MQSLVPRLSLATERAPYLTYLWSVGDFPLPTYFGWLALFGENAILLLIYYYNYVTY